MNNIAVLCLVLIAAYGLISMLLSALVACTWIAWLEAKPLMSRGLFAPRMLSCLRRQRGAAGVLLSEAALRWGQPQLPLLMSRRSQRTPHCDRRSATPYRKVPDTVSPIVRGIPTAAANADCPPGSVSGVTLLIGRALPAFFT
jgi:hypothetical protein